MISDQTLQWNYLKKVTVGWKAAGPKGWLGPAQRPGTCCTHMLHTGAPALRSIGTVGAGREAAALWGEEGELLR